VCCFSSKVHLGLGFDSHTCISFNNCCVSCAHYECYILVHVFFFYVSSNFNAYCYLVCKIEITIKMFSSCSNSLQIPIFFWRSLNFFSWCCINIACSSFCGCLKVWDFCHSVMYVVKFSIHVAISMHDQICICKF
jgi:hypothetical protein